MRIFLSLILMSLSAACQQVDDARRLLDKMNEEFAGRAQVRNITGVRYRMTSFFKLPQGEITVETAEQIELPDRVHIELDFPGGKFLEIASPEAGFFQFMGNTTELTPEQKKDLIGMLQHDIFLLLHKSYDPDFFASIVGDSSVGMRKTKLLKVEVAGQTTLMNVDPETGRVLSSEFSVLSSKGERVKNTVTFSDWRDVEGYSAPFRHSLVMGDGTSGWAQIEAVELNPPSNPELYVKSPITLSVVPMHAAVASLSVPKKDGENAPAKTTGAKLIVSSVPGGAQVYLDNRFRGLTSEREGLLILENLEQQSSTLRVSLPGFEDHLENVHLESGTSRNIGATLKPKGAEPLHMADIEELLRNGVSKQRVKDEFVAKFGVDFELTPEFEKKLRAVGADDALLLKIATLKR